MGAMSPLLTTMTSLASGAALALTGCGVSTGQNADATTAVPAAAATTASARTAAATSPAIRKVLVFVVENHSLSQMKAQMPRVYRFASRYAYATDYTAITHPSLPNYLAMVSGSTLGVSDDNDPSAHRLTANNVFRQALAHHKSAKVYADSMPAPCYTHSAGEYAVKHNPWAYFVRDRAACQKYDVPARRLAADVAGRRLPNIGFVIPNLVHDAHDGTLAQADRWIARRINLLRSGRDWASGHLAIVVTADEDDSAHGNRVLTVVASRYQHHKVVARHLTHYSLTKLLDSVIGAPALRHAKRAPSMRAAFGIR